MATLSSILAWRNPWIEEPGGLQSTGSKRAGQTEQLTLPFPLNLRSVAPISWSQAGAQPSL